MKSGGKRFNINGKEDLYEMKGLRSFSDKVGWREDAPWYMDGNRKWISYRELSFDGLPPVGHLPLPRVRFNGIMGGMMTMSSLATNGEEANVDVQMAAITSLWIGFLVSSS